MNGIVGAHSKLSKISKSGRKKTVYGKSSNIENIGFRKGILTLAKASSNTAVLSSNIPYIGLLAIHYLYNVRGP